MILIKEWTGEDIRRFREEFGWSQREFAEQLGIRTATVSDWERGLVKLSRVVATALTYLELDHRGELTQKSAGRTKRSRAS